MLTDPPTPHEAPEKPLSFAALVVVLSILVTGWVHPNTIAARSVVTDCDREAADPWDGNRVAEGVPFKQIDGDRAVEACQRALTDHPDDLRLNFQYGRSIMAREWKWLRHAEVDPAPFIQKAATAGYAPAQYYLGYLHRHGYGVARGFEEAAPWYQTSAESGYAPAERLMGHEYLTGGFIITGGKRWGYPSYKDAARWLRKAAEQGYVEAVADLGDLHNNRKLTRDHDQQEEALRRYRTEFPDDPSQAVRWYRQAAEEGHVMAQNELGFLYASGWGVKRNYEQAVFWYSNAAEHIDTTETFDHYPLFEVSPVKGWASEAAENLGMLYLAGRGVPKNEEIGARWIHMAATKTANVSAQAQLGYLYLEGRGLPEDPESGYRWIKQASDNHYEHATLDQALLEATGHGTERNPRMALYRLNQLIASTNSPFIQKIAKTYAGDIRRSNPGVEPWSMFNRGAGKNTTIGSGTVLVGLALLAVLLGDDQSGASISSSGIDEESRRRIQETRDYAMVWCEAGLGAGCFGAGI
jgi:TPR repeat protein